MLNPGRFDHLNIIVDEIEKYEQMEPIWQNVKTLFTASVSIAGTTFTLFIKGIASEAADPNLLEFIGAGFLVSLTAAISFFYVGRIYKKERAAQYKSKADEIRTILKKTKKNLITVKNTETDVRIEANGKNIEVLP